MKDRHHNPFRPGDWIVLDRPAKAKFMRAPDGSDEWTEMFRLEKPFKAWHEIAGVSRIVNSANLQKMMHAGLVEQFGEPTDDEPTEFPTSFLGLEADDPENPRRLTLLGGAMSSQIQIEIEETNHKTWGARVTINGVEVYGTDSHEKRGVTLFKAAAAARALAFDLKRFALLVEEDASQRNRK